MKRIASVVLLIVLVALPCLDALAYKSSTLKMGSTGSEVKKMQQALIDLGFLSGKADGKFGTKTQQAVTKFQKSVGLTADGLAGTKTLNKLYEKQKAKKGSSSGSSKSSGGTASLFGGDYSTLREGSADKTRVKALQKALIKLKYLSGSADGKFGPKTTEAVKSFQAAKKLTADGLAGKKTLQALEKAYANGETKSSGSSSSGGSSSGGSSSGGSSSGGSSSGGSGDGFTAPSSSQIKKLYWYNDIKNKLIRAGQYMTVYDPSTGKHWTLRALSLGRHADAEPLTKKDTDTMVSAFGGKNTWNQKAVYVRFPNGTWTIGSTHDMPHESGHIKDNGFNGHLCVHFIRTMEETQKNDPNYGVDNQNTIRKQWNKISSDAILD